MPYRRVRLGSIYKNCLPNHTHTNRLEGLENNVRNGEHESADESRLIAVVVIVLEWKSWASNTMS